MTSNLWIVLAVAVHLSLLLPGVIIFQSVEPYMDEIFHIPQAQKYCEGQFQSWDPKITTFPGLYLLSALSRSAIQWLLQGGQLGFGPCSALSLRRDNLVYSLGVLVVLYRLLRRRMDSKKAALHALSLSLYPVHFFFGMLYYTDVGSLFWVLLAHHLATPVPKKALPTLGYMFLAAASGSIAILFRQTNAVWLMFTVGTAALEDLQASKKWGPILKSESLSLTLILTFCKALLLESKRLLRRLWPLLIPVLLFVTFVFYNGSIVVGDHTNHKASLHLAQLAYCIAVTASMFGFAGSDSAVSLSTMKTFCAMCCHGLQSLAFIIVATCITIYLLHFYSFAHPFLLADNRHYTFYIWGRFLGKYRGLKEVLAPAYVYCAWLVSSRLSRANSSLWVLIWWIAVSLTLVPASLLEPRYWTTAVLMAHANADTKTLNNLCFTSAVCLLINGLTQAIFVFRPFTWPSGETARFMW